MGVPLGGRRGELRTHPRLKVTERRFVFLNPTLEARRIT